MIFPDTDAYVSEDGDIEMFVIAVSTHKDFSDAVTSVISEHYDSGYVWLEINDGVGGSIDVLRQCVQVCCISKDSLMCVRGSG